MALSYRLNQARRTQQGAIYDLYVTVMKPYIAKIWGWDEAWQREDFRAHFDAGTIVVASANGGLVGFSQMEPRDDHLFLRMLAVLPEHRRQGLGSRLVDAALAMAETRSQALQLEVFKINEPARRFYEQRGFRVVGDTPTSYVLVRESHKAAQGPNTNH